MIDLKTEASSSEHKTGWYCGECRQERAVCARLNGRSGFTQCLSLTHTQHWTNVSLWKSSSAVTVERTPCSFYRLVIKLRDKHHTYKLYRESNVERLQQLMGNHKSTTNSCCKSQLSCGAFGSFNPLLTVGIVFTPRPKGSLQQIFPTFGPTHIHVTPLSKRCSGTRSEVLLSSSFILVLCQGD